MKVRFNNPKIDHATLSRSLYSILRKTKLCAMATSAGNRPFINNAFFCFDEALVIFFVSDPHTQHGRNLTQVPQLALAVADSHQAWDDSLRGCQFFGRCRRANKAESHTAHRLYGQRFPAYRTYQAGLTPQEKADSPHVFYVYRPTLVKLLDVKRFGDEVFIQASISRDVGL